MKIKIETHPLREYKASTVLKKTPPHTENVAKKWRIVTTHDRKYRGSGQKSRVQLRSQTSSPAKSPNEMGEDANSTYPVNPTANCAENQPKGKREEEETDQTWSAPPPDSSGNMPADTCCKYRRMSSCKNQRCACRKAGCHCTDFRFQGCATVPSTRSEVQDKTTNGGGGGAGRRRDAEGRQRRCRGPHRRRQRRLGKLYVRQG